MYFIFLYLFTIMNLSMCKDSGEDLQTENNSDTISAIVEHKDAAISILKTPANNEAIKEEHGNAYHKSTKIKPQDSVVITCYKNGLCLIKDVRKLRTVTGVNNVEIDGIFPEIVPGSVVFRTPKKGKISVQHYAFHGIDSAKSSIVSAAIGEDIYFSDQRNEYVIHGKLLAVSSEKDGNFAIIDADNKTQIVPFSRCIAVGRDAQNRINKNSLKLAFDSKNSDNMDLEINYLARGISWKYISVVDIFEKLDRVDICAKVCITNNTDFQLNNASMIFDDSVPDFLNANQNNLSIRGEQQDKADRLRVNLAGRSSEVYVLKSIKELKPSLQYMTKFSCNLFEDDASKDLRVANLLIFDDAKKLGLNHDFTGGDAFIFQRMSNDRKFLGKRDLGSLQIGNNFVFEIGRTTNVSAKIQRTDLKRISEKEYEYSVKISLKNNKPEENIMTIVADADQSWSVTKSNFEMIQSIKPTWVIKIKPSESTELHFRVKKKEI